MKLRQFIDRINQVTDVLEDFRLDEIEVCVVVKRNDGVIGIPAEPAICTQSWMDFDTDMFMIYTQEPLVRKDVVL